MKKFILLSLCLFTVNFIFSVNSSYAQKITLSYVNFFPPTHFNSILVDEWCREIEKLTNNKVEINYFPGETLLKGKDIFNGVEKGIADIGMSCFAYTRGRFPAMEALDLPVGYQDGFTATMAANAFFKHFSPNELDKVKVLYLHAHGPGLLHTKKPVSRLEDVKGIKIRATGFSANVASALGALPVGMGQGDAYEALQKGVVDGTFAPIETLLGWKQAELVKYTVNCFSIGYTTAMFAVINKRKWDSLSEEVQKIFETTSHNWIEKHAKGWDAADSEAKEYCISIGNKMIDLSDEEQKRWSEAASPVISDYIDRAAKKGLPSEQYIEFLKNTINTIRK